MNVPATRNWMKLKGCEVNFQLKEICKERNLQLIDHSKTIKPIHSKRGKLYLNQERTKVVGDFFFKQISTAFNWHCASKISASINVDDSFPVGNFLIDGFSTAYTLDRDSVSGGILLHVREDIPSDLFSIETKPI